MAYPVENANLQGATQTRDTISGFGGEHARQVERLGKIITVLKQIGDRIDGPRPEPVAPDSAGQPEPPASMILQFKRSHMLMNNLISQCEDEIRRLAIALGVN